MGQYAPYLSNQFKIKIFHRLPESVTYNIRVALWQLPYDSRYKDYDEDGSKWFESTNKNSIDEIELAEKNLRINLSEYKVRTKKIFYNDDTVKIESKYKNNTVTEIFCENYTSQTIKDNFNQIVAEKIFDENDGKKYIYQNYTQGKDKFTIVKVYSYDPHKNRATDVVNYGYTSDVSKLTKGCTFEKEYYMLNGKEVQVTKTDSGGYIVRNKDGKILTFQVE